MIKEAISKVVTRTDLSEAEMISVMDEIMSGDATEAHAVIPAFPTDQTHARGVAANVVIGERNLERGVDGLGTGVAEKYVIEIGRGERGNPAREFKGLRMAELERRRRWLCHHRRAARRQPDRR